VLPDTKKNRMRMRKGHPRRITRTTRMVALSECDGHIIGTTMSGAEVCRVPVPTPPLTAGAVTAALAEAPQLDSPAIELLRGAESLEPVAVIEEVDAIVAKVMHEALAVFVCCKADDGRGLEPSLGEGCVDLLLPETTILQGLQEHRNFVTMEEGLCWLVYGKKEVSMVQHDENAPLDVIGLFPQPPAWPLPAGARQWGGARCDVWSAMMDLPTVKPLLDEHAALTCDRPIPRYQMIVDPNQFVRQGPEGHVWIPCEFDVSAEGSPRLLGGKLSHDQPRLAREVATPVLQAALPLLARLQRPQLLLESRRLQVVFKAQSIILPPQVSEGADSEYVGLWHIDGHVENVAAVVLYYYKVDPALRGGDMEFCGREPMDVLGFGDCSNNFGKLSKDALRTAFRDKDATLGEPKVQSCRVPVKEKTLLVFSNYQMIHRVLRMVNTRSDAEASRDFVALFVIDPAMPPLVPASVHLAHSYSLSRTLHAHSSLSCVSPSVLLAILEFMGVVQSKVDKRQLRAVLLGRQLQPQGQFVGIGNVYATGNGCYTMIGWLQNLVEDEFKALGRTRLSRNQDYFESRVESGWQGFIGMGKEPQHVDRGMSEAWSLSLSEKAEKEEVEQRRAAMKARREAAEAKKRAPQAG